METTPIEKEAVKGKGERGRGGRCPVSESKEGQHSGAVASAFRESAHIMACRVSGVEGVTEDAITLPYPLLWVRR